MNSAHGMVDLKTMQTGLISRDQGGLTWSYIENIHLEGEFQKRRKTNEDNILSTNREKHKTKILHNFSIFHPFFAIA